MDNPSDSPPWAVEKYVGIQFIGQNGKDKFWYIVCPCGVEAVYPLNKLPEVDTPHPCGKADHWTIKFD